ncbi:DUF6644 family protein [Chitinophaga sp. GCM10012297]|uniref:DUF6644 domain-containing protein n=1 Tax=Chitinophaga chungangae TaxID=2821488 RepID=A0ABS3YC28_9BACT|nr:DUF6644 family protein [Chitinophaga chungangae]MBO9152224.1 hypothetical protein [Chitinophaga chungangae]
MAEWLQFLEHSAVAAFIRQSLWLYPVLEIVHITGIVLLVGPALMFDLRLLGSSKHLPVAGLGSHLLTWSVRGLWLVIPSGILLFVTNAGTLGYDPVFWTKMSLLALAAANALWFRVLMKRGKDGTAFPAVTKLIAIFSIVLWTAIIACGRLLAY